MHKFIALRISNLHLQTTFTKSEVTACNLSVIFAGAGVIHLLLSVLSSIKQTQARNDRFPLFYAGAGVIHLLLSVLSPIKQA